MPHKHSLVGKARANRIRSGKRWAEYLYAHADSLFTQINRINDLAVVVLLVKSHMGLKRFFANMRKDELTNQFVLCSHFEVIIHTESALSRYVDNRFTFSTTHNRLSKMGGFAFDDLEGYTSGGHAEIREMLQGVVYKWIQDTIRGELCKRHSERIREELVAAVWHPQRVARRLEEGGWDAVDIL